jgi:hypothetical protein
MSDSLLITNGTVVTWESGHDLVENGASSGQGRVSEAGSARDLESRYPMLCI